MFGISLFNKTVNMNAILLTTMEEYIRESKNASFLPVNLADRLDSLKASHATLTNAGLTNSKNAKIILTEIESIESQMRDAQIALELMLFVKRLRSHFGDNTILISKEQFKALCSKYNLTIGIINDYTGVIPEKNLNEITFVLSLMEEYPEKEQLNKFFFKVNELRGGWGFYHEEELQSTIEAISKYCNNIVYLPHLHKYYAPNLDDLNTYSKENNIPLKAYTGSGTKNAVLVGNYLNHLDLLIACPANQLKIQPVKLAKRPIDPIVFQYCPYGVIVHSVWGEEAEDKVFEEYKRINNLMLNLRV